MTESYPAAIGALLALGAFHGINPGMGWLFAVALGLQERRRAAVWLALGPLAVGHALAIAGAAVVAWVAGSVMPASALRWAAGASLMTLGVMRLRRHRHPRYGGMRVGLVGLTAWSFVMATAHGAGLMVLPWLIDAPTAAASAHAHHGAHHTAAAISTGWAVAAHGLGYLITTTAVAVVVYEKLGVGVLRKAWINLDLIWAAALVGTGLIIWVW